MPKIRQYLTAKANATEEFVNKVIMQFNFQIHLIIVFQLSYFYHPTVLSCRMTCLGFFFLVTFCCCFEGSLSSLSCPLGIGRVY